MSTFLIVAIIIFFAYNFFFIGYLITVIKVIGGSVSSQRLKAVIPNPAAAKGKQKNFSVHWNKLKLSYQYQKILFWEDLFC